MDKNYHLDSAPMPTTKRRVDLDGADFYPTPEWATYALMDKENFVGDIWECACGNGSMSTVLGTKGNTVYASDLHNRGYGTASIDFLASNRKAKNIVTNPPFHSAQGFVKKGLELADKKLCLLLRLAFLEGGERADEIFLPTPPSRVWVFSERVTFYANTTKIKSGGTTAYAWFIWDKYSKDQGQLGWLRGYKNRDYSQHPIST